MSAAVWGFVGALVGGLCAVAAQIVASVLRGRQVRRDRLEQGARRALDFQRTTLIELETALADYRAALARDASQRLPTAGTEAQLSAARSRFQMLVYRVASSAVRDAVLAWETAALAWFGGDDAGTAAAEATSWDAAMRTTGEAIRAAS
jgi:leucyl aminopeptidase (aminopeptidase T)